MPRKLAMIVGLATLSATPAVLFAQNTDSATSVVPVQQQAAPIERQQPQSNLTAASVHGSMVDANDAVPMQGQSAGQGGLQAKAVRNVPVAQGVWLRSAPGADVQTVATDGNRTELRLQRGLINVDVHHPIAHREILVDMPDGGQVALLKDGVYTFNGDTQTASVYKGEAKAFAPSSDDGVKVKEDHEVNFALQQAGFHANSIDPENPGADLLPASYAPRYGYDTAGYYPGSYGYYGDPYWAYGYPYGWGYPWFGVGFYGGYYGGYGYRGGFGGGGGFRGAAIGGGGGGFHGGGGGGGHR